MRGMSTEFWNLALLGATAAAVAVDDLDDSGIAGPFFSG
jgi:hypothetical protein